MTIPKYSVLSGHPVAGGLEWPSNPGKPPHYMIRVPAAGKTYKVAVNVQSQDLSEILYHINFQFHPPLEDALRALPEGLTRLESVPGGLALDFLRQGLVKRDEMHKLLKPSLGHGAQLLGAVETLTGAARDDADSLLFAFGSAFPGGIHDIHMNQGNPPGNHDDDNGTWQDGAVYLFLPSTQRWIGVFLAFQTQSWTTDAHGRPSATLAEMTFAAPTPEAFGLEAAEAGFVPRHFAAVRPTAANPATSRPAGRGNQTFHPHPKSARPAPHRMALAEVLRPNELARIADAGRLVFHLVGDTGNAGNERGYQMNVARQMERQLTPPNPGDRPAFLYIPGDVIYFHGEETEYDSQFYEIYDFYDAPIFAIPGNHDGDNGVGETSLGGFVKNFCAPAPVHSLAAHEAVRDTMTQPNPYWTLNTPLVTVVGLYSNVPEHGMLDDPAGQPTTQEDWFVKELAEAPTDRPVLVALHHPPYALDKGHGGSARMAEALERAMEKTGRTPAAVFSGHVHNYQRFTRVRGGRQIPHVVAGCGGFPGFHQMLQAYPTPSPTPWPSVALETYEVTRKGFLRMTVTADRLNGEFFTVPLPGELEDGPTVLRDRFVLDWKAGQLVTEGVSGHDEEQPLPVQ